MHLARCLPPPLLALESASCTRRHRIKAPRLRVEFASLERAARHGTLDRQRDTVELPVVKILLCTINTHTPQRLKCMQITAVQARHYRNAGSLCPTKGMGVTTTASGSDVAPFPTTTESSHCLQTVVFLRSAAKCWCLEVTSCRHHPNPFKPRESLVFVLRMSCLTILLHHWL